MNNEREITFREALREGLASVLSDEKVLILGEDISSWGGRYNVTDGLVNKFGPERVVDTPLIEEMVVGIGFGLALGGFHPVIELMYGSFLSLAIDDIYRVSTWRFRYPQAGFLPIVIRVPSGAYDGRGQEFSAHFMSWFQHIPGLTVLSPATPYDVKGLLISSVMSRKPILFFEDKKLYPLKGVVPENPYSVSIGSASVVRTGDDVTIIGCGYMTHLAQEAATKLSRDGISAEVLDLRTIVPLDIKTIVSSVGKTRNALVVEQGIVRGGIGSEIGMCIVENVPGVKITRVGAPNVPPAPLAWEEHTLPSGDTIYNAARRMLKA